MGMALFFSLIFGFVMPPKHPRPLSPHLQIYRPQWTSVLSILHRITGAALAVGLLMLTWFFYALSAGPATYGAFLICVTSPLGMLALMGWSFALCFHACSGVRHLIFDTGHLLSAGHAETAGKIVVLSSLLLTLALWLSVFYA